MRTGKTERSTDRQWLAPQPFLGHPYCVSRVSRLSLEVQLAKCEGLLVKNITLFVSWVLGHPKKGVPLPPKPKKGGNRRREGKSKYWDQLVWYQCKVTATKHASRKVGHERGCLEV